MTTSSDQLQLTVAYARDEQGWTKATIPAVPGAISMGRNRNEARDNVLDALRELLSTSIELPHGAVCEDVTITLALSRGHDRAHDR